MKRCEQLVMVIGWAWLGSIYRPLYDWCQLAPYERQIATLRPLFLQPWFTRSKHGEVTYWRDGHQRLWFIFTYSLDNRPLKGIAFGNDLSQISKRQVIISKLLLTGNVMDEMMPALEAQLLSRVERRQCGKSVKRKRDTSRFQVCLKQHVGFLRLQGWIG